jgi:gluconolactonase
VTCEHGLRRVIRTEADGSITVLADSYLGKRLNSPNDVVVQSDGSVWFTDPTYGILSDYEGYKASPEQPGRGVYRVDGSSGAITCVVDDFCQPNGLAFSPDERTLYIADSGASHDGSKPRHIRAFDVAGDRLTNDRVFALIDAGIPDGIRTDTAGNLWSSAADGVHCFAPDGRRLGKVLVPEAVANLCFGGPRRNRLFITASTSLYAVYLTTSGAQRP